MEDFKTSIVTSIENVKSAIQAECIPTEGVVKALYTQLTSIFHIPFLPAFTRPGWLLTIVKPPYTPEKLDALILDGVAGLTVAFTLIPQALSYAKLAGMPPISGLYSFLLPSVCYIFGATSMLLGVGAVAIVSLLMGELLVKYDIDSKKDPIGAYDFAAQVCVCVGVIKVGMGLLNLGSLIRFISYPVLTGFTNAAAMLIGLSQMRSAFGFPSSVVPRVGSSDGVQYNYQLMKWYHEHWHSRDKNGYRYLNVHAVRITFGLYIPLATLWVFNKLYKPSEEVKKSWKYKMYKCFYYVATLVGLCIAGRAAYDILQTNTTHHAVKLEIVGDIHQGIDCSRSPSFHQPWGALFVDCIPLVLISYMESYSVARKIASDKGQLGFLNPSQDLVALGVGNFFNAFMGGFPVSGSFSRSALYVQAGASTPVSKFVTLLVVLFVLGALTSAFHFIPLAALSAVIWLALLNLIDVTEFWKAWKHSKKDFWAMLATFVITLVYDTETGIATGIIVSLVFLLHDMAYSLEAKPILGSTETKGVEVIRLNSNLVFISSSRIKDTLIYEIFERPHDNLQVVVINFVDVKHIDLSGLLAMKDVFDFCHKKKLLFVAQNVIPSIDEMLVKMGIVSDEVSEEVAEVIAGLNNNNGVEKYGIKYDSVLQSEKEVELSSFGDAKQSQGGKVVLLVQPGDDIKGDENKL